ncbi:hypothetical protein WEI85_28585 [Actinomycetes bacterium KLBMP 9797]
MRIVRTAAGILLLVLGLPVLVVGGALGMATQHRDAAGGFGGAIERITTPGRAVVVADLDRLLRRTAPFARGRDTSVRVTAETEEGPALIGLAPMAEVARYLAGVPYARVDRVSLGNGPLPVRVTPVAGGAAPAAPPAWIHQGAGAVEWASSRVRGQRLSLIVMHPDARAGLTVDVRVTACPGWLPSAAWGLLVTGAVLLALGTITLPRPTPTPTPTPAPVPVALPMIKASFKSLEQREGRLDHGEGDAPAAVRAAPSAPAQASHPVLGWPPPRRPVVTPAPIPTDQVDLQG